MWCRAAAPHSQAHASNSCRSWAGVMARRALGATLIAFCAAALPSREARGAEGGSIRVLLGTGPDSLDPQLGNDTQARAVVWLVNLGLLTYRHVAGSAGTEVVPALAEDLPVITNNGTTYRLRLRPGLMFSDGTPVRAGSFARTVERAIRLNWGGKSFIVPAIVGSREFEHGSASTVSGIHTDDSTGTITIDLIAPNASFSSILALPALGLVPQTTPLAPAAATPVGAGPYMIAPGADITRGFRLVRNPRFAARALANVPAGHLDEIDFDIISNNQTAAQDVLDDRADVFDAYDTLPPSLLEKVRTTARARYTRHNSETIFYTWMNMTLPPFSDERIRQAVALATDRRALQRLGSGMIVPECFLIPAGMAGHPDSPCPFATSDWQPDLERARRLVRESGLAGSTVTVWGQQDSPGREWAEYIASTLQSIGLQAGLNILANSVYYAVITNKETRAQMGIARFEAFYPDPSCILAAVDGRANYAMNTYNLSRVEDAHIQENLLNLQAAPVGTPQTLLTWQALGRYVTEHAYVVPWGSQFLPQFYSSRLLFTDRAFHPIFANDWTLLERR
jgi:peptide/nickel transport system substrate-binding protein